MLPTGPDYYSQLLTKVRKMAVPFGDDEVLEEVELGVADLSKGLIELGPGDYVSLPMSSCTQHPTPPPE